MATNQSERLLSIARGFVYVVVFLLPLFFLPVSLEILEINKQTLLVLLTLGGTLAWIGSMLSSRTLSFRGGWMNAFPTILFAAVLVSAALSQGNYLSWIGNAGQEYMSVLSMLAFVTLFYLVANTITSERARRLVNTLLLASATLVGLIGASALFGFSLPFDFARSQTFNTVGTVNAFAVYLVSMAVFGNALWVTQEKNRTLDRVFVFALSALALVVLLVIDYWILWAVLLAGLSVLFVFAVLRANELEHTNRFVLPFFLAAVALLFLLFLATPFSIRAPVEVTPSFSASWQIAQQSLEDSSALFGSGPGTFLFDYARHRPLEMNQTAFWDVRFDRAASFALTVLANLGVLGAFAWLAFLLAVKLPAVGLLIRAKGREEWKQVLALFVGWSTLATAAFLYGSNMTLLFSLFLFSGLIAASVMGAPFVRSFRTSPRLGFMFSFLFVFASIAVVTIMFVSGQRYVAEASFAKAVRLDRERGTLVEITTALDRAARMNRFNDVYYRNLAQALLLRVGEELATVKDAEQMTPEGRQYIQALSAASVNAGVTATQLGPENVANWLMRGAVYREFIPLIGNAAQFAVEAYRKVVDLEPGNPANWTELGVTELVVAEASRAMTAAQDESVKALAQKTMDESLAKAEADFNKALELKADYSPAHYQLAILFERQGKLDEAIGKMESVRRYNQLDVGVAFQLGVLYMRRGSEGDLDRAKAELNRVIELAPTHSNARWFLASIYEQQGDLAAAIEQVQKVAELNPDNAIVTAKLERLKSGSRTTEIPSALP